jgi:glycosyltransferase involved in cell wall biosynthesis
VVLGRMLRKIDPRDYVLITREQQPDDDADALPATRYQLQPARGFGRVGRRIEPVVLFANLLRRTVEMVRIARRERVRAILACTGDIYDLPASYLASRVLRVPFHAYLFDDYVFQWPTQAYRSFARRLAPWIMRGAQTVIVPNEFLRDELLRRYGTRAVIVRNPYDLFERASIDIVARVSPRPKHRRIVYTGTVYHAHFDAFRNLIAGIRSIPEAGLHLDIYTSDSPQRLEAEGITGPVSIHGQRSFEAIRAIQAEADILFLPLAFDTTIPEVIRTSAPGKMGEYLASGRPILVHAPRDSFVVWYFREHDCGVVVDALSPDQMTSALRQLTENTSLVARIAERARTRADVDFNPRNAEEAFLAAVGGM